MKKPNSLTWSTVWQLVYQKKRPLFWGQLVTLLGIMVSVPIPLMLPEMVDEVVLQKSGSFVHTIDTFLGTGSSFYYISIIVLMVITMRVIYFFITVLQTKIFTSIAKYTTFKVRTQLLSHLQTAAMTEYERLGSGAIGANLITDVNTLDNFIGNGASKFIASIFTLLGVALVMFFIHPLLAALILIFQPIVMLITKKISKNVGTLKRVENEAVEDFQQEVGEVLELFGQIKASNKESFFFERTKHKAQKIQHTSNEFGYKSVAAEKFSYTLFLSAFEIFRAAGLLMVIYSDLSVGMMFAMFGYIWFIMTPMQDILSLQYSFASANAALKRLNTLLTLTQEPQGKTKLNAHEKGVDIALKELSFAYNENREILQNITMNIKAGEKVAIIGSSGSGKTTLAQIISAFYPKRSGSLQFNTLDIDTLDRQSLRSKLFMVLQMPILFNDSLRFNITMGEDFSNEAIMQALEIAQMKSTVLEMKEGLNTVVGRHGIRLSGGQRQRLAIARMILCNPDIVIFDESTSALDVHTEAKLFTALDQFLRRKTVITIAHRLSTVKNADTIYVLESGKIVQHGSHDELEREEGHYIEFIKRQANYGDGDA